MRKAGLDEAFMVKKMKEWADAKKTIRTTEEGEEISTPDYGIQLRAYDRWEKLMNPEGKIKQAEKKREITFTEWISGKKEEPITEATVIAD